MKIAPPQMSSIADGRWGIGTAYRAAQALAWRSRIRVDVTQASLSA